MARLRAWFPALSFLGGFAWDALTLGRVITPVDLLILLGYYLTAAVLLTIIGRRTQFRFAGWADFVAQFLFGGIFSALFIFYFLSSSSLSAYIVVGILLVLLVGNEFKEGKYRNLTLAWTLFTVCGTMFFNFGLPHLFHSVSHWWFYLSTAMAVCVVFVLRLLAPQARASVVPSVAVGAILILLQLINVIPPVPLVKREMLIAQDARREADAFVLRVEPRNWWTLSSVRKVVVHRPAGQRLFCFTSVFVPRGLETKMRHRWEVRDEANGRWTTTSLIPFTIRGGRSDGYRGYTWKRNVPDGEWRVSAESEDGDTIGVLRFRVISARNTPELRWIRR